LRHKAALLRELPGTQDPRDITEKSLSRILKSQILPPRFHRFAPETASDVFTQPPVMWALASRVVQSPSAHDAIGNLVPV